MNVETQAGARPGSLWKSPAITTALILLIPVLGNAFVDGWNWDAGGFVVFGAIVFGLCVAYQLVARRHDSTACRAAAGIAFVTSFLLVMRNFVQFVDVHRTAALFFVVPLVAIVGAARARLRPAGMARAMFATAIVQASVVAIVLAILIVQGAAWTGYLIGGVAGNAVAAMAFVASALLFRQAERDESRQRPGEADARGSRPALPRRQPRG